MYVYIYIYIFHWKEPLVLNFRVQLDTSKFHLSLFLPPCGISCGFISLQLLQVGTWFQFDAAPGRGAISMDWRKPWF